MVLGNTGQIIKIRKTGRNREEGFEECQEYTHSSAYKILNSLVYI